MKSQSKDLLNQNKAFAFVGVVTAVILAIPLFAMQFTSDAVWTLSDFLIMGVLLFGSGSLYIVTARRLTTKRQRLVARVVFLIALLYIWAELAVGIFTNLGR